MRDHFKSAVRDQFGTLSISNYVIKKGCPHGSRHGKTEEQTLCRVAYNSWKRCRKKKDATGQHYTGILDRFVKSPRYRKSQENMDGRKRNVQRTMHWLRKTIRTRSQRQNIRFHQSGPSSSIAQDPYGPMAKRSDYHEAVQLKNRLHHESREIQEKHIHPEKATSNTYGQPIFNDISKQCSHRQENRMEVLPVIFLKFILKSADTWWESHQWESWSDQ